MTAAAVGATAQPVAGRDRLNDQQAAAVGHGAGAVLVIAGAGTGKTMTIAHRVAHLIERGTPPERILLLTFSRRAAAEMLARATSLTGQRGTRRVWGGTFHAVSAQLLRLHGRAVGVQPDFTVLDQPDTADLLDLVRGSVAEALERKRFARKETLADIYSRTVNAGTSLREVLERWFPWCAEDRQTIRAIVSEYTKRKRRSNLLDYDDLLLFMHALVTSQAIVSRGASITCSSTSTRTSTGFRPRSSRRCIVAATASSPSVTTRRRSTRSAPPRWTTS